MTKIKTDVKLPDVPSELINLAMDDFEKCLSMPDKYRIDMDVWYSKSGEDQSICEVCLAGSVMCQTLSPDTVDDVKIGDFSPCKYDDADLVSKLQALDKFREGNVDNGLYMLDKTSSKNLDRYINPFNFVRDMRKLADDLKAAGL